jgi:pentatricopeptide repeat protein
LVDMYAKCGSMEDAHRVFNKILSLGTRWYLDVKYGQRQKALELYQQMQQECVQPDRETFEHMCQCTGTWRGQMCSWVDHWNWVGFWCYCGNRPVTKVCKMWELGGCSQVQQDAFTWCGHLECAPHSQAQNIWKLSSSLWWQSLSRSCHYCHLPIQWATIFNTFI